jgi:lysophospholipase L1-like esterase
MLVGALLCVACTDNPIAPPPPPPLDPISLRCPQPLSILSPRDQPTSVAYVQPIGSSGAPPVTVTCTPASGAIFQLGTTMVMCTGADAQQRTASCSFSVTVTRPPRLSVTRFVAFGDSITAGEINNDSNGNVARVVDPVNNYPVKLQGMLTARYTAQQFLVSNQGQSGNRANLDVNRLASVVTQQRPDVLLLLEGVNDIDGDGASAIPAAIQALRSMILIARGLGVSVYVGTLLPQRPSALRAVQPLLVPVFNNQLVPVAVANGAKVVDLYTAFLPHLTTWIGADGLHPNAVGYEQMAQIFFNQIKTDFEVSASTTLLPTFTSKRRR